MIKAVCRFCSVGITAVGAGALLLTHFGLLTANTASPAVPEVEPAAFSFAQIYPWVVGPSTGAAALAAAGDSAGVAATGALQAVNELGPLAFDLNSVRAFSANQAPPGSNAATVNYTDMDQWATGIAGLASSTGALGFAENGIAYDPFGATHAGVLQTANNFGPFFFDLNVLKAIGLTQAPSGTVLASGQPDNFSAVDIGRWNAGLPGVITNSGTTGFVTYQDFGAGPISDYRVGGLHTTTQIGATTFDFNVLPSISTGIIPPSLSFGLAPDMTAANTPFAPLSPPTPGIVQPNGGLPAPAAVSAVSAPDPSASAVAVSDSAPVAAADVAKTPNAVTSSTSDPRPAVVIPGVNGAPLIKTPTGTSGVAGGDPFRPLKPITDAIANGIGALTGTRPGTASGAGSTGAGDGGSGGGADSGGSSGSGAG